MNAKYMEKYFIGYEIFELTALFYYYRHKYLSWPCT